MKDEFNKLFSENTLKNYWYSRGRQLKNLARRGIKQQDEEPNDENKDVTTSSLSPSAPTIATAFDFFNFSRIQAFDPLPINLTHSPFHSPLRSQAFDPLSELSPILPPLKSQVSDPSSELRSILPPLSLIHTTLRSDPSSEFRPDSLQFHHYHNFHP